MKFQAISPTIKTISIALLPRGTDTRDGGSDEDGDPNDCRADPASGRYRSAFVRIAVSPSLVVCCGMISHQSIVIS